MDVKIRAQIRTTRSKCEFAGYGNCLRLFEKWQFWLLDSVKGLHLDFLFFSPIFLLVCERAYTFLLIKATLHGTENVYFVVSPIVIDSIYTGIFCIQRAWSMTNLCWSMTDCALRVIRIDVELTSNLWPWWGLLKVEMAFREWWVSWQGRCKGVGERCFSWEIIDGTTRSGMHDVDPTTWFSFRFTAFRIISDHIYHEWRNEIRHKDQ